MHSSSYGVATDWETVVLNSHCQHGYYRHVHFEIFVGSSRAQGRWRPLGWMLYRHVPRKVLSIYLFKYFCCVQCTASHMTDNAISMIGTASRPRIDLFGCSASWPASANKELFKGKESDNYVSAGLRYVDVDMYGCCVSLCVCKTRRQKFVAGSWRVRSLLSKWRQQHVTMTLSINNRLWHP